MENQPTPVRPWFRLASQARMELRPPAPQPQPPPPRPTPPVPRIPLLRAALAQIQAPPPPPPPPSPPQPADVAPLPSPRRLPQPVVAPQPTPSPPPQSPRQPLQPVVAPQPTPSPPPDRLEPSPAAQQAPSAPPPSPRPRPPSRTITPPQSPKVIRPSLPTPPPSPRYRQPQRATSPQVSYPEPEPEPQLRGKFIREVSGNGNGNGDGTTEGNGVTKPMANDIKEQSRADMRAPPPPPSPRREEATAPKGPAATQARKPVKEAGGEMKVITIAGDNIGAYMEVGSSSHRRHPLHSLHNRKQHQNVQPSHQGNELGESGTAMLSDDGNHGEEKTAKARGLNTGSREGKPMATAVVNSNVQSVNNSILFSSSCGQHSPGVHVTLSSHRKPKGTSLHKGH